MKAGQRPILFKGWISVFVNRNDTDILVDNQRNQRNLRANYSCHADDADDADYLDENQRDNSVVVEKVYLLFNALKRM